MGMFTHFADDESPSVSDQVSLLESRLRGREEALSEMKKTLEKYLRYPSCDGRAERQQLRKELSMLLDYVYDVKTHSI